MNSSGLIYAVIVGAWAAYLVPMWLRRQDELNESRPTERFSTAIRLLSGKAAMERRYARESERREGGAETPASDGGPAAYDSALSAEGAYDPVAREEFAADTVAGESVDVRAYADPKTIVGDGDTGEPTEVLDAAAADGPGGEPGGDPAGAGQRSAAREAAERGKAERETARQKSKRAKVLARRRRTTMVLFLAFTAGTILAAVGGVAFLWAPGVPGALLSAYIVYLRVTERRRFAAAMDKRRRMEAAAQERRDAAAGEDGAAAGADGAETEALPAPGGSGGPGVPAGHGQASAPGPSVPGASAPRREQPAAEDCRALVEQTDHAEWVDQQRRADSEAAEGWEPVPVPLPTYVSAPVAPRSTRGVDLEAPDTWSSARSSSAGVEPPDAPSPRGAGAADAGAMEPGEGGEPPSPRRARGRRQTPLFDQYEGDDRPRAANE